MRTWTDNTDFVKYPLDFTVANVYIIPRGIYYSYVTPVNKSISIARVMTSLFSFVAMRRQIGCWSGNLSRDYNVPTWYFSILEFGSKKACLASEYFWWRYSLYSWLGRGWWCNHSHDSRISLSAYPGSIIFYYHYFSKNVFGGHIHMSYFGATGTLFWISGDISKFQSQSRLPYSHCRGECDVHSPRSTSRVTHCQPLDGQHFGGSNFRRWPNVTTYLLTPASAHLTLILH